MVVSNLPIHYEYDYRICLSYRVYIRVFRGAFTGNHKEHAGKYTILNLYQKDQKDRTC